jgi:hypothetical protein
MDYRVGISDHPDHATLYHHRATFDHAYETWAILADYGRDGVTVTVEQWVNARWVAIDPTTREPLR